MAWMAGWAAEFTSKHSFGDDERILYGRIRKETCQVPPVTFGERVMYVFMAIAISSKGDSPRRPGIWFGTIERTEETIIGTRE